jgi:hypothetical protein
LYIAFLDLSKAFDRVWREGLLAKLWESGIQGKPWHLIKEIEQIPCSVNIWSSIRLPFLKAPCDSPSILLDSRWTLNSLVFA